MPCIKCGSCCEGLFVPNITEQELFSRDGDPSIEFIQQHWKVIAQEEGEQRASWVHLSKSVIYLECDQFDLDLQVCTAYEERPYICSGYPFYKGLSTKADALPPKCGYRKECDDNG